MQILIIIAVGVIYMHDGMRADGGHALLSTVIPSWAALIIQVSSVAIILFMHWLCTRFCLRMLDRRGLVAALGWSERLTIGSHIALVICHLAGILLFGWIEAIRRWIPDLPGLCEIVILLPLLSGFIGTWLINYPIEVRWFNAMLARRMDDGTPIHAMPSRLTFAFGRFRHGILLLALPMLLIMAWSHALDQLSVGSTAPEWIWPVARLSGVLLVVTCMPLILRLVWDTIPLESGNLRDRLLDMCQRHRIGINNLLLWRTHGAMANGAVLGIIRPVRYILLTDRLLEMMNSREVEAVMAHEIAHIKHRHLLFLSMSSVGSILVVGTLAGWMVESFQGQLSLRAELFLTLGVLLVLACVFGFVSRRFEWQADAFAAGHLSMEMADRGAGEPGIITANAASIMIDALQSVADLNGILPTQFSFRHGSIHTRQQHLRRLIGLPITQLPIDRTARRLKLLASIACLAGLCLAWMDVQRTRRDDHHRVSLPAYVINSRDATASPALSSIRLPHPILPCTSGEKFR
jgi:Zn-dependent protease with chaperone function